MLNKSISIITCTKNRKESLFTSVRHFYRTNSYPENLLEYIIVNDGDDDLSYMLQEFKGKNLRILKNKGNGLAAARNTGSYDAKNDLLLYLDDDILITPDHLSLHVEANEKFFPCIVTPNRETPEELIQKMSQSSFGRYLREYDYVWHEGNNKIRTYENKYIELEGLAGFSCSIQKELFHKIGPFNEKFPAAGNEDLDFYWRARVLGIKLIYDTRNNCFHNEKFNLNIKNWLKRQLEGMISFLVLCDLYKHLIETEKYKLYTPINSTDSALLILKKGTISLFSVFPFYNILLFLIIILSRSNPPQKIMNKLFNFLVTLNYKKGVRAYAKN